MDVPLVFVGKPIPGDATIPSGNLVDIVPTILNMFGLPIPKPMDGKPLLDQKLKPYLLLGEVKLK